MIAEPHKPQPLVTVITVVLNAEKFVEQTIRSVIGQTYDNIEYIVIDGASTDGTLNVIRRHEESIDCWISEPDKGIYDAINKGISRAHGEFINVLNAGDYYSRPTVVSDYINLLSQHPQTSWAYAPVLIQDERGVISENRHIVFGMSRYDRDICHQSMFYKKELHSIVGLYNIGFPYAADRHFILKIRALKKYEPVVLKEPSIVFRLGGVGITNVGAIRDAMHVNENLFRGFFLLQLKAIGFKKLYCRKLLLYLEGGRLRPAVQIYKKVKRRLFVLPW